MMGIENMICIEIKTAAYSHNKNFNAIHGALLDAGYKSNIRLGGKFADQGSAVMIFTDAPLEMIDGLSFTRSAVQIRA